LKSVLDFLEIHIRRGDGAKFRGQRMFCLTYLDWKFALNVCKPADPTLPSCVQLRLKSQQGLHQDVGLYCWRKWKGQSHIVSRRV